MAELSHLLIFYLFYWRMSGCAPVLMYRLTPNKDLKKRSLRIFFICDKLKFCLI